MDPQADPQAFAAATAASRQVVTAALDAFNRLDVAAYVDLFADDLDFRMPGSVRFCGHRQGKQAFLELGGELAGEIDGALTLTVDNMIAGGEWVVTQVGGTATTKDGKPYNNTYCLVWRVVDGRIVALTEYNDTDLIRRTFSQT